MGAIRISHFAAGFVSVPPQIPSSANLKRLVSGQLGRIDEVKTQGDVDGASVVCGVGEADVLQCILDAAAQTCVAQV